jgi:hypothetical protein
LARIFSNRHIPTGEIAFYNDERFVVTEKKDPAFLQFYAAWVRLRFRDATYETHVRRIVPRIVEVVGAEIARDGKMGVCIDASMMLTKMLELEGVWCYAAKGALSINAPSLGAPTHFYMIKPSAGHVWVVAPPFEIVDVALGNQLFTEGEEKLVSQSLVLDEPPRMIPRADDFCSPDFLAGAFQQRGLSPQDILRDPALARPLAFFPSFEVKLDRATLRYAAGGVTVSDGPSLHSITSHRWNGKRAGELYDEVVRPALVER